EGWDGERLHVVRDDEVAFFGGCHGTSGAHDHEPRTRTGAQVDVAVAAGRLGNVDDVPTDRGRVVHLARLLDHPGHARGVGDRSDVGEWLAPRGAGAESRVCLLRT